MKAHGSESSSTSASRSGSQHEREGTTSEGASSASMPQGVCSDRTKRQKLHSSEVFSDSDSTKQHQHEPLFQSAKAVGRVWHFTRRDRTRHRSRSVQLKIVSYNVLADSLLHSHPMLYDDCEEWVLNWEYRKKNLLKEILFYNSDILCLQEVQENHYADWFLPELSKAGYQGLYKKRTGDKVDGCAVFYRGNKFTLLEHRFLNYKMDHVPVMDRDNIAILALLQPKYKDGRTCYKTAVCVANTHLLFNRNRGDIKLLQLASLFAEINKLRNEFLANKNPTTSSIKRIPILLCGDFNMTPSCSIYKYISTGYLNYKHLSKKELSGQNKHGNYVASKDRLRGNIIPQEMGLTNMSTWDNVEITAQTASATDSAMYDSEWPSMSDASSNSFALPHHNETVSQLHAQACSSSHHGDITHQEVESIPHDLPKPAQFDPHCAVIRHRLFFFSVYRHILKNNVGEVTTYHEKEPSCTVDYIFASPGREETCHVCRHRHSVMELTGSLSLLSEEDVSVLGGLPSELLSSDHLALVASFALHL